MEQLKRFDTEANKARNTERMLAKEDGYAILGDSTFSNFMDVVAEEENEIARYIEFCAMQNKWTTARTLSALTAQGGLIGRKLKRAKSAIGYVIVSHTDAEGVNRLDNYGTSFFSLDELSDYDNIEKSETASTLERQALVPWTYNENYTIPKGTIFTALNGTQFIATQTVTSRTLTKAFNVIADDSKKYTEFLKAGGWDGIKYLKVPVIQGIQRELSIGTTTTAKFQTFMADASDIERASNKVSKQYFYCMVGDEKWVEISNIRLAGPYDKVFEAIPGPSGSYVKIKFGDGVTGRVPNKGQQVVLHYLETEGSLGNIETPRAMSTITFENKSYSIDPRAGYANDFLSVTNITSIMGGQDTEDELEYRTNAPVSYHETLATGVKAQYKEAIMNNSSVSLSQVKINPATVFTANQLDTIADKDVVDEVSLEVANVKNVLNITCISANGNCIEDEIAGNENKNEAITLWLDSIVKTIGDTKGTCDYLSYTPPNMIRLAIGIKAQTSDNAITDTEAFDLISAGILNDYSIMNQVFDEPLYTSKIIHVSSLFEFVDSISMHIEALANINYEGIQEFILSENGTDTPLLAIPFAFDRLFASDSYNLGFKNYTVNADYLLKVDMKWTDGSHSESDDKTFFLFDKRVDNLNIPDLQSAKSLVINSDGILPSIKYATSIKGAEKLGFDNVCFYDETLNGYDNRQCRVAQFQYINKITDAEFMANAHSYTSNPYEVRPYEIDSDGANKIYEAASVSAALRVSTNNSENVGNYCYKKNVAFIDNVDILFEENYDSSVDSEYAHGWFLIPTYSILPDENVSNSNQFDSSKLANATRLKMLKDYLKGNMSFKIYAQPKQALFEPSNWNDIIFVDDDDIKVEKTLKLSN